MEKDIVQKIKILKEIKPDQDWIIFCRKNLLSQIDLNDAADKRFLSWETLKMLGNLRLNPIKVVIPLCMVLAVFIAGFIVNVGQISEQKYYTAAVVLPSKSNSDSIAVKPKQNSTNKNDKKSTGFAGNVFGGVIGLIERVKTVTLGEYNDSNESKLREDIQSRIEVLKKQVENLLAGSIQEKILAEQAVLILKDSQDFLDNGDLTGAFDKIVAAERSLNK